MLNGLKSYGIGFLISFIGSIPLGFLNLIGTEIYQKNSILVLFQYLFGVVLVESILVYGTYVFVSSFTLSPKWKRRITLYSAIFFLFLAYYYFAKDSNYSSSADNKWTNWYNSPFILGLLLSAINVAQIPFWFSWNLVVHQEDFIQASNKNSYIYIVGTAMGTFLGMLTFIVFLKYLLTLPILHGFALESYYWLIFIALAIFQLKNLIKKP